ncbi:MAG: hypothetical protein Q7S22_02110 [Candidatus Micrarchaeota archaeon]|nr:hypothetical protein [Candidatus Micrarchaeota archaeon]
MASEEEKKLVLARLATMPLDMELSLGDTGSFDREQLIHEVENETKVGDLVITVYMNYLRSFKQRVR